VRSGDTCTTIANTYRAGLGLDNLSAAVLDAACMTANDEQADLGGVHLLHAANERAGAHNIERGDSQHPARA
jgi:hypothetical protein